MSAPSASGRCSIGEAKVLSTTTSAPRRWAISATAAMSTILSSGLVGVSTQTSFVFGVNAASNAARSVMSTKLNPSPALRRRTRSNRR